MTRYTPLLCVALILSACKPETERYIQPELPASATSQSATVASEAVAVSAPLVVASEVVAVSQASGVVNASGVAIASGVATASAVGASTPATSSTTTMYKGKKIVVSSAPEFGSTTYLFPSSLKKDGKLVYVLTETHFKETQKLPESNKPFRYSLIKEAVDCKRKLTDPVSVTHFSEKNEKVESHEYPYPDYNTWTDLELQALANEHPDRAFIETVCNMAK